MLPVHGSCRSRALPPEPTRHPGPSRPPRWRGSPSLAPGGLDQPQLQLPEQSRVPGRRNPARRGTTAGPAGRSHAPGNCCPPTAQPPLWWTSLCRSGNNSLFRPRFFTGITRGFLYLEQVAMQPVLHDAGGPACDGLPEPCSGSIVVVEPCQKLRALDRICHSLRLAKQCSGAQRQAEGVAR